MNLKQHRSHVAAVMSRIMTAFKEFVVLCLGSSKTCVLVHLDTDFHFSWQAALGS